MPKEKAPKLWFDFFSVNGERQHRKQFTAENAAAFAKEEGYIGRYKEIPAPVRDLVTENRKGRKRK